MQVDRHHPARLGDETLDVAVVIDVLRATSTAVVLLAKGAKGLAVVASPAGLSLLSADEGPYLYVSEFSQLAAQGDRIDNSPVQAEQLQLAGRTAVLITTNGTRALDAAASRSTQVLVASFLNVTAVARHLERIKARRVTLLPAGDFEKGETRPEDELCADALEQLLSGGRPDLKSLAEACRNHARIERRILAETGFAADLELCLSSDRYPVVPSYQSRAPGLGWLSLELAN